MHVVICIDMCANLNVLFYIMQFNLTGIISSNFVKCNVLYIFYYLVCLDRWHTFYIQPYGQIELN